MTVHVNLILEDAPSGGVTLRAYGPLRSDGSEAAFVARTLLRLAAPLFAGGRPVRMVGDAALVGSDASDEFCACDDADKDLTAQEIATLRCQACGKGLLA
jgi:hypothetical protein